MRDHGTPVYDKRLFFDISRTFSNSTSVAIVRLKGKPVAAAFMVKYRNTVEVPWAASMPNHDVLGVNMFLYHSLLQQAVSGGYRYFDFGRSTRDGSTYRFKKQWGAKPYPLSWNIKPVSDLQTISGDASSAKFRVAIGAWKILPVWLANRLGPPISGQLPW